MVKKTVLDSGLIIISEYIPTFPSFALSYTIRGGSRIESLENNGIHHFIEHMIFKGTSKYSLKQIADISDRLGGHINAFTSKEITQYYIKAIDEKLKDSFELLTDIVMNSTFPESEFLKEQSVVIQEIKESEDNPDTHSFETLYEDIYKNNGLGYPIGGKEYSVSNFQRDKVYDFYKTNYTPDKLVLAAVGNIHHEHLVHLAADAFKDFPSKDPKDFAFQIPEFYAHSFYKKNPSLKQIYVIIGFEGITSIAPLRHQFSIMNDILGGGMSSRLFQKIREEKGLTYTISTFFDKYLDCGIHLVYSIVGKETVEEYLAAVKTEILRLKREGITEQELSRSRDHIKASVILGMENNVSRMRFLVNHEVYLKREMTIEEIVACIDNTTVGDINRLFLEYLNLDKAAIFLYGDVENFMIY